MLHAEHSDSELDDEADDEVFATEKEISEGKILITFFPHPFGENTFQALNQSVQNLSTQICTSDQEQFPPGENTFQVLNQSIQNLSTQIRTADQAELLFDLDLLAKNMKNHLEKSEFDQAQEVLKEVDGIYKKLKKSLGPSQKNIQHKKNDATKEFNIWDWLSSRQTSLENNRFIPLKDIQKTAQITGLIKDLQENSTSLNALSDEDRKDFITHIQRTPEILRKNGLPEHDIQSYEKDVAAILDNSKRTDNSGITTLLNEMARKLLGVYVERTQTLTSTAHQAHLESLKQRTKDYKIPVPQTQNSGKPFQRRQKSPENVKKDLDALQNMLEGFENLVLGSEEYAKQLKEADTLSKRLPQFPKAVFPD